MSRRLVAVLACRLAGTRLYGKPLQNLTPGKTILAHIVEYLRAEQAADEVVLAIADGPDAAALVAAADALSCRYVLGSEEDVLGRLILAAEATGATDVLRKTTESPYFATDEMHAARARHIGGSSDITVVDHVPLGTAVECYTLDALKRSHMDGRDEDRSELVSNYARHNQAHFTIDIVAPPTALRRTDVRLTVDYPEDLIISREVYRELQAFAPSFPLGRIVEFYDRRPDLKALVEQFVFDEPIWDGVEQRSA